MVELERGIVDYRPASREASGSRDQNSSVDRRPASVGVEAAQHNVTSLGLEQASRAANAASEGSVTGLVELQNSIVDHRRAGQARCGHDQCTSGDGGGAAVSVVTG